MNTINNIQKEKLLLAQLQEILLTGDRSKIQKLQNTLDSYDLLSEKVSPIVQDHLKEFRNNYPDEFRSIVNSMIEARVKKTEEEISRIKILLETQTQLSQKVSPIVSPIVEDKIENLKQNFPTEYKTIVNQQIEKKLVDSQEEILNVITPVMGKLIRKSITHQFQMLKERIDKQIKTTFSKQGIFGKIFGYKQESTEVILSNADATVIEEVYVIQRDSGLLMGSAAVEKTMDQDVIAGMFTAIKAFVEDAFQREEQELEMIEYGNYKIYIQNFYSYYVAVAMSGSISATEKNEISNKLYDFAEQELKDIPKDIDDSLNTRISNKLKEYFFEKV